jgi:hypothetical protein
MSELAVHPVAALFPMLADDELDELAASIKANGLLQPIVIDTEGAILDGRHRLKACQKADVKPRFETYKGRCHVCGFYLSIARGRCLKRQRLRSKVQFGHRKTQTFIAGMRCDKLTGRPSLS